MRHHLRRLPASALGRHLLFWIAYFLYVLLNEGWQDQDTWAFTLAPQLAVDLPTTIGVVYANLYGLLPRFYQTRRYGRYLVGLLLLLLAGGLLIRFFSWWVWLPAQRAQHLLAGPLAPTDFWIAARIVKNAAGLVPLVAITMVLKLLRQARQYERQLRAAEQEKFAAELGLLKAQLNPHFFFNTLNSIYALTLAGSPSSPAIVLRLAELMRYMLYEATTERVSLLREIAYLEHYIGIEQVRFADRLELSFQHSGETEGQHIAPLLLLPFVENAFKHGLRHGAGWITIDLKLSGNHLFLRVENSYSDGGDAAGWGGGLGLLNAQRRLQLTYPQAHELHLTQAEGVYTVVLRLTL